MSKIWKQIVGHVFETTNKFDWWKIGVPDFSVQERILKKPFLSQNMSSRCPLSPAEKNQDFGFFPLPAKPVSVKNDHLNDLGPDNLVDLFS